MNANRVSNSSTSRKNRTEGAQPVNITETFVPFDGTIDEFKDNTDFQQMVDRHGFVIVTPGTHCSSLSRENNEKYCRRGIIVSTLDW